MRRRAVTALLPDSRWARLGAVVLFVAAASTVSALPSAARSGEPGPVGACPDGAGTVAVIGPHDLNVAEDFDNDPKTVEVGAATLGCGPMEVTARVDGVTARHRFEADANGDIPFKKFSFDPCGGGKGSDLPGTGVEVTGRVGSVTVGGTLRLGPDTTKPRVKKIQSSPPPGSTVEKGDKISFEVVGKEDLPGATWQTGVQTLQVTGPQGLIKDKNAGRTPKACGNKSESLTINNKYKVRGGDPAVIEICGIAEDYATNEESTCAQYYKGEVWDGTYERRIGGGASGCTFSVSGTLQVVVASDGGVSGGGSFTAPPPVCPQGAGMGGSGSLTATGTRENGTFHLTLTSDADPSAGEYELAVRGTRAEGEVESTLPDGSTDRQTITLKCQTCEGEAVG
jgi:hypothetical protein